MADGAGSVCGRNRAVVATECDRLVTLMKRPVSRSGPLDLLLIVIVDEVVRLATWQ